MYCPSTTLWVPNSSSTAVTSSVARRWMLDMIVDRGGATAVSELPAAGSVAWPAGRCSWSKNQPADRQGSANRQAKYDMTSVALDRDHLMAVSPLPTHQRHRSTTTQLPRESSTYFGLLRRSTKFDRCKSRCPTSPCSTMRRWQAVVASSLP